MAGVIPKDVWKLILEYIPKQPKLIKIGNHQFVEGSISYVGICEKQKRYVNGNGHWKTYDVNIVCNGASVTIGHFIFESRANQLYQDIVEKITTN